MKNSISRIIFYLWVSAFIYTPQAEAQQVSQYTQYLFNYFGINPAAGGSNNCLELKGGYRRQWWGFESAPRDQFFSICGPLKGKNKIHTGKKNIIGFYEELDRTGFGGPTSRTAFYLNYSFHTPLVGKWYASAGVHAGLMQYAFIIDNVVLADQNDNAIGASRKIIIWPDINPGLLLYHPNFFLGYSMKYAIQNKLDAVYGIASRLKRHHLITTGASIPGRRKEFSYMPSINVKLTQGSPFGVDVKFLVDYNDVFRMGVVYRKTDAACAIVQFRVKKLLVGYAFDFNTSKMRLASANGHEIVVGYRICNNKKGGYDEEGRCYAYD